MTQPRAADTAHREIVLEDHLVEQLVIRQGYRQRQPDDYDRASALDNPSMKCSQVIEMMEQSEEKWGN
jgi:hypothetical protein